MKFATLASVSVAASLVAATASAQSAQSSIAQSGATNSATVVQVGSGGRSSIAQGLMRTGSDDALGQDNIAEVTQTGTAQSLIVQDRNRNEAYIIQSGNVESVLHQLGLDQIAEVEQIGEDLGSTITQGGFPPLDPLNRGDSDNLVSVEQRGLGHRSGISQTADDADAVLYQAGTDNTSLILQGGGNEEIERGDRAFASVDQNGTLLESRVAQRADDVRTVIARGGWQPIRHPPVRQIRAIDHWRDAAWH